MFWVVWKDPCENRAYFLAHILTLMGTSLSSCNRHTFWLEFLMTLYPIHLPSFSFCYLLFSCVCMVHSLILASQGPHFKSLWPKVLVLAAAVNLWQMECLGGPRVKKLSWYGLWHMIYPLFAFVFFFLCSAWWSAISCPK